MKTVLILGGVAIGAFLLVSALDKGARMRNVTATDNTSSLVAGGLVAAGSVLWDKLFAGSGSGGAVTHTPITSGETIFV